MYMDVAALCQPAPRNPDTLFAAVPRFRTQGTL
jgi:hypothetical protein